MEKPVAKPLGPLVAHFTKRPGKQPSLEQEAAAAAAAAAVQRPMQAQLARRRAGAGTTPRQGTRTPGRKRRRSAGGPDGPRKRAVRPAAEGQQAKVSLETSALPSLALAFGHLTHSATCFSAYE